jgi:addiction module HigA family antidote
MAVTPIHPGEHLKEELAALDMSAAEVARKLNVPTNRITHILNGRRGITGDTALRLSHFFVRVQNSGSIFKVSTT